MPRQAYLFRFGFCTPRQWQGNEDHDWDDESSSAFFVEADNPDDALTWGREVAERAVAALFRAANVVEMPSWKASQFAH